MNSCTTSFSFHGFSIVWFIHNGKYLQNVHKYSNMFFKYYVYNFTTCAIYAHGLLCLVFRPPMIVAHFQSQKKRKTPFFITRLAFFLGGKEGNAS